MKNENKFNDKENEEGEGDQSEGEATSSMRRRTMIEETRINIQINIFALIIPREMQGHPWGMKGQRR